MNNYYIIKNIHENLNQAIKNRTSALLAEAEKIDSEIFISKHKARKQFMRECYLLFDGFRGEINGMILTLNIPEKYSIDISISELQIEMEIKLDKISDEIVKIENQMKLEADMIITELNMLKEDSIPAKLKKRINLLLYGTPTVTIEIKKEN